MKNGLNEFLKAPDGSHYRLFQFFVCVCMKLRDTFYWPLSGDLAITPENRYDKGNMYVTF